MTMVAVFRYGVANLVCRPCQLDRCFECEGTDPEPCECACPSTYLPEQRNP